jgi:hypothetical protein
MGGKVMAKEKVKEKLEQSIVQRSQLFRWSKQGNFITLSPEAPIGSPEHIRDLAKDLAEKEDASLTTFIVAPEGTTAFPTLSKAMELVNRHIKAYSEDFYWHDIDKLMRFKEGIWGIRPSGTVFIEIDPNSERSVEQKKALLEYASYYLLQNQSTWFYWTPDTLKKIPVEKATSLITTSLNHS